MAEEHNDRTPAISHREWLKAAPAARQHFVTEIETMLKEVPEELWHDSSICGICYDFLPWHETSIISFQSRGESRDDIGGWKHYECVTPDGRALDEEFQLYKQSFGRLVYHRLLIEAAEAFLTIDLTKYRRGDIVSDGFLDPTFRLQVYDADGSFKFNYCEYVLARRFEH